MADDPKKAAGDDTKSGILDDEVREHLARKLRHQYDADSKPPAYLGDSALPPEFEHQLVRVASSVAAHEKGVNAVQTALESAEDGRLLAWCKRERESMQMQREMLQSGRFRIYENNGPSQRDISDQHAQQLTENIAELDAIIAECEAERG